MVEFQCGIVKSWGLSKLLCADLRCCSPKKSMFFLGYNLIWKKESLLM